MPSSERRIWIVRGEGADDGDYQCKAADVKCCCFNFRSLFFARRIENHREHQKPTAIHQQRLQQVEGGSDSSFRTSEVRSVTEMDSAADHSNRISHEVSRRRPPRIPMETTAGGVLQAYPTTTHYSRQDPHFNQNYHLQAYHHHPYYYNTMNSYPHRSSSSSQLTPQLYNSYLHNQNNQLFLHGKLGGSSSSVMDAGANYSYNNGRSSSGSYSGRGYSGNFLQLPGSTAEDPLPMVKVDYDNNFPNQTYAGCIW